MTTLLYLICATAGGTIVVVQFIMAMIGLGGDAFHLDTPGGFDGGLHGADFHTGDFHGGGDLHGGDLSSGELHSAADGDHLPAADLAHGHSFAATEAAHVGLMHWFLAVLSFRTIVAGLTFFGLVGLAAQAAGARPHTAFLAALAAGASALYIVYWIMRGIAQLRADGTVRVQRTIGRRGKVYLRVPGNRAGLGKIQINVQDRTMEYLARTAGETIPTGATIVVTQLVNSDTVEVEPVAP